MRESRRRVPQLKPGHAALAVGSAHRLVAGSGGSCARPLPCVAAADWLGARAAAFSLFTAHDGAAQRWLLLAADGGTQVATAAFEILTAIRTLLSEVTSRTRPTTGITGAGVGRRANTTHATIDLGLPLLEVPGALRRTRCRGFVARQASTRRTQGANGAVAIDFAFDLLAATTQRATVDDDLATRDSGRAFAFCRCDHVARDAHDLAELSLRAVLGRLAANSGA
jgi:hypothetical protein